MRLKAIVIEIKKLKKGFLCVYLYYKSKYHKTEIRLSNFYLVWKWNHFIEHQLQVNYIYIFLNQRLTFSFNLRYYVFQLTT